MERQPQLLANRLDLGARRRIRHHQQHHDQGRISLLRPRQPKHHDDRKPRRHQLLQRRGVASPVRDGQDQLRRLDLPRRRQLQVLIPPPRRLSTFRGKAERLPFFLCRAPRSGLLSWNGQAAPDATGSPRTRERFRSARGAARLWRLGLRLARLVVSRARSRQARRACASGRAPAATIRSRSMPRLRRTLGIDEARASSRPSRRRRRRP